MKQTGIIIIILVIVALGALLFVLSDTTNAPSTEESIGGNQDDHGCLTSAGYSWCEDKQKCLRVFEEFCADESNKLASDIEENSGVTLNLEGDTSFNWIVYSDEITADYPIDGILYTADNIKWEDYDKIETFMNENYDQNFGNLADGVVGGEKGYFVNYMACLLNYRYEEMQENEEGIAEPKGDSLNVKLECGYFNRNNEEEILTSQRIKEILAEKYNKQISGVTIGINKYNENYASGSVLFGEGGPGEGGMFLATNVNGDWEVVFDGNGMPDCDSLTSEYNFPEDMLERFCY